MNLPNQSQPIIRQVTTSNYSPKSIAPSSSCGCPNTCVGLCLGGTCTGICV